MKRIKSINLRSRKQGMIHALNGGGRTLCGRSVENSYYSRWHPSDAEITCSRCLRAMERGSQ